MCRFVAYHAQPIFVDELIARPRHSLMRQSLRAEEAKTVTNGDGFGVGWYGEREEPGVYREVLPAWSDDNLVALSATLKSHLFFAHVRAATGGGMARQNCHPFRYPQLIGQFTGEAVLLSGFSLFAALAIVQLILPAANTFTGKALSLSQLPPAWMAGVVGIMLLTGVLSSLYPAYLIARVAPAQALKSATGSGNARISMRKILVAGQFAVSILMISSTLVIYRQLNYVRAKDTGISVSDLLVIDINSPNLRNNFEQVKAEFSAHPEVLNGSTSTRVPGEWKSFPVARAKTDGQEIPEEMIYVGIDQDFFHTYGINLLKGRNFSGGREDSTKVILTQLAVDRLGLKDPIGQIIEVPTVRWGASIEELEKPLREEVIGVADNFHFESLRQSMSPVVFAYPNTSVQRIDYYTLQVKTSNWPGTLDKLRAVNIRIDPENPLSTPSWMTASGNSTRPTKHAGSCSLSSPWSSFSWP